MQYVSYLRVSTKRQGESGLGIEAQNTAVNNFLGLEDQLLAEYRETESGKKDERPMLMKAIEQCKQTGATLLIARLDRLSRNAAFIFTLRNANIQFKCIDVPEASHLTIGILAVLAEDERIRISQRTHLALKELKAKGVQLGKPKNLTDYSRQRSIEVRQQDALDNENNRRATALITSMRSESISYQKIAEKLNTSGFRTRNGKQFTAIGVKRLYDRYQNYYIKSI